MAAAQTLPSGPLVVRDFTLRFDPAGTFTLSGVGWPTMAGTWTASGNEVTLQNTAGPKDCLNPARYSFTIDGARVSLAMVADDCKVRQMILDGSQWLPPGASPAGAARRIVHTPGPVTGALPAAAGVGHWPSFRGREASGVADGQNLPERWNPATGENILWKTSIPGLSHSSPIVWGDVIFVTSAISSRQGCDVQTRALWRRRCIRGSLGASLDAVRRSIRRTGKIRWERTAAQGPPRNKRHIKSTYASASPATDGRIVVAWFGSQGLFAYDVNGGLRWSVDLGRVDMGAYDIPSIEWGPASSPIIWNGLVIVQCDTQADSFLLALDAATGKTVWKTDRQELPSWGTPTIVNTPAGPELITNASNFVRGYDPKTGKELWHLGGSSKITAPTPIFANGLHIVASGRAPERPVFAVKPGARGDFTLAKDATASAQVAWSKTGRGSYMPTPLAYRGLLYVLANNGVLDAYEIGTRARRSIASGCRSWAAASARRRWRRTGRFICRMKTARCW